MPRPKMYDESEVIQKAMQLFWRVGFKKTTARMMEDAMGINLFSIYSSFGNKEGVLNECLKAYKDLNQQVLLDTLNNGTRLTDIEAYFINFLKFTKSDNGYRGCLLINTAQEFGTDLKPKAASLISDFSMQILEEFRRILAKNDDSNPSKSANYLFASLVGLITSAKVLHSSQIEDYLDITFSKL